MNLLSHSRGQNIKTNSKCQFKDGVLDFAVESYIEKFLGVNVSQVDDVIILRQLHLTERIIATA